MFVLDPVLSADTYIIGEFEVSLLLLSKDANYPWCILVPKREGITELYQLEEADQLKVLSESRQLTHAMTEIFAPKKMNIATLGNVVSQLHIHHIARYEYDPAWPRPVWGSVQATEYTRDGLAERIQKLKTILASEGFNDA